MFIRAGFAIGPARQHDESGGQLHGDDRSYGSVIGTNPYRRDSADCGVPNVGPNINIVSGSDANPDRGSDRRTATTGRNRGTLAKGHPTSELKLLTVAVAEIPDNLPDYDRQDWKHWTDADGDCQDARNEVLVAESRAPVSYRTDRRCRVADGEWLAPYTSTTVTEPSKLDIDHMVPLRNAHLSGAWQWSAQQRERYANFLNDPQHLIAVTASVNCSKGERGPEDWKPGDRSYWCQYTIDWVTIEDTWELTATAPEFTALQEMLSTCDVPHQLGRGRQPGKAGFAFVRGPNPTVNSHPYRRLSCRPVRFVRRGPGRRRTSGTG